MHGTLPSKPLNNTEFTKISPAIVYCLLPATERNNGGQHCTIYRKNNSELFNSFARNFSGQHSKQGITHEALEGILEEINKTIGEYLGRQKVCKTVLGTFPFSMSAFLNVPHFHLFSFWQIASFLCNKPRVFVCNLYV